MLTYHTVLCALDFEPGSERALLRAADLAERSHASLHLLHVHPLFRAPKAHADDIDPAASFRDHARAFADRALGKDAFEVLAPVVHESHGEAAADGILRYAASTGADLIVVGTHGRQGLGHFILGSVAAEVLRQSAAPVLVVPERAERTAPGPDAPVLVGADFSEHTGPALTAAQAFAKAYGAPVAVAHVRDAPREAFVDPHARPPLHPPTGLATREEAHQALDALIGDAEVERYVVPGRPAAELLGLARSTSAGLVVVGTHGRQGWEHLRLGSVAEDVVRQAPCPVLVVPRPAR